MIFIKEGDYSLDYQMFIYDQLYEQQMFNNSLSMILSEAISDETKDKAKQTAKDKIEKGLDAFIDKMIDTLANVVTKFLTKLHDFANNNKTYMETYKDIILNKKPLKAKISGHYDYNLDLKKGVVLPYYTVEQLARLPKEKNEYIKAIPEFKKYFTDTGKSFADNVKFYFRGGDAKEVDASTLDMKKMYNFIIGYNTELEKIVKEAANELKKEAKKMKENVKRKRAAKKANRANNQNNTTQTTDTTNKTTDTVRTKPPVDPKDAVSGESFTYTKTLAHYFNEGIQIKDDENQEKPKKIDGANVKMAANNGVGDGLLVDINDAIEGNIKLYITCRMQLIFSYLTIMEEAYRNYMRIIKWHVGKFVEDPETVTTTDGKEVKGNFTDTGDRG